MSNNSDSGAISYSAVYQDEHYMKIIGAIDGNNIGAAIRNAKKLLKTMGNDLELLAIDKVTRERVWTPPKQKQ